MSLTTNQQEQFELYALSIMNTAFSGDKEAQELLVRWVTSTAPRRLESFKEWATLERSIATKTEADVDERVTKDKATRSARDVILAEIENLTSL